MDYDTEPTFAARYLGTQPTLTEATIRANHLADAYHGSGAAADIAFLLSALASAEREIEALRARLEGIEDRAVAHVREMMWGEPSP